MLAQLGGGLRGALCTWAGYGGRARSEAALAAIHPAEGVSVGQAFLGELPFVLVLVVISVATDDRAETSVAVAVPDRADARRHPDHGLYDRILSSGEPPQPP